MVEFGAETSVEVAFDYTKREHVFRVRVDAKAEMLFQAATEDKLLEWTAKMQKCLSQSAP
jgi:hypothetical protein